MHESVFSNEKNEMAEARRNSTPSIAAKAAQAFNARRLVLSCVGNQYFPIISKDQLIGANILLHELGEVFDRSNHALVARDFMKIDIPVGGFSMDPSSTFDRSIVNPKQFPLLPHATKKKRASKNEVV
jgi:hypothetical protein